MSNKRLYSATAMGKISFLYDGEGQRQPLNFLRKSCFTLRLQRQHFATTAHCGAFFHFLFFCALLNYFTLAMYHLKLNCTLNQFEWKKKNKNIWSYWPWHEFVLYALHRDELANSHHFFVSHMAKRKKKTRNSLSHQMLSSLPVRLFSSLLFLFSFTLLFLSSCPSLYFSSLFASLPLLSLRSLSFSLFFSIFLMHVNYCMMFSAIASLELCDYLCDWRM